MKLKIAVVGPEILVHDISKVTEEFEEIEVIPMIYSSELEAPSLITQLKEFADLFLFSGQAPYYLSQKVLPDDHRAVFIPFEGTDIYSVLAKIYQAYHFFPIISFDCFSPQHLQEVYEEMGLAEVSRFTKTMEGYWDSEELFHHHMHLWTEKKVQVIATGLHSVYKRLKQLKVPVFLIKHTKQTIRETVKKAILMGNEQKKHGAQITVLQFQIDDDNCHFDTWEKGEYLEVKQKILAYGNELFSSSGIIDGKTITLYTTRGILEKVTNHLKEYTVLNEIRTKFAHTISLGIGMGNTGESAVYNASRALLFARQNGGNCAFLIDDEKKAHGPLGFSHPLEYSLINVQEGNFSSLTVRKFFAWLSIMRRDRVTAREVSIGMNTSDRHAIRILKKLRDKGVAEVIGKESMNQRGRPRPIYKIDLISLAREIEKKE
ncbi:hypothetical protein [Aneurinibacillus tyrosinisolvens]|uniref:hypothetical protein n=1 Tax=Aneurinibacillus tyrosinisolvens TaxID=1443435 RepID=UPI00063EE4AF|nr:hypothetical protein [Aneurinibacillus tyrosinisolvens]